MMSKELYHYGVLGMKWGRRRYQNKDGTLTAAGKARRNAQIKKERKSDSKNRRLLSDRELKQKIERLKLEKQLKELTAEDVSPGRTYASGIIKNAGSRVLTNAAAGGTAYAVKYYMTKKFNISDAASYIAPNPNKKK